MNIPPEIMWAIGIPSTGGVLMWAKSVESRLAKNDAVIDKIGRLADLLLEDRLDGPFHPHRDAENRRREEE